MTLLSIHILTAVLTLTLCVFTWVRPTPKLLTPLIISSLVSIITGISVSLDYSLFTICAKLGIYSLAISASIYKLVKSQNNATV